MIDPQLGSGDSGFAALIAALAAQAEAIGRIEARALPLLERIALALERRADFGPGEVPSRPQGLAGFRLAIRDGRWEDAGSILGDLEATMPDHPDLPAMRAEGERSRAEAAAQIRSRIEAARGANDPDAVLSLRGDLARVEAAESARPLDLDLVKWLMALIHRRLRVGTIRVDLVELAGRVAERFGTTTEGASLAAALPTLRRSAGLCPRCAEPYTGLADACPRCLGAAFVEPPPLASRSRPRRPADRRSRCRPRSEPFDLAGSDRRRGEGSW